MSSESNQATETPQNQTSKSSVQKEPLLDRIVLYFCVSIGILPLLMLVSIPILYPFDPEKCWGTEAEAIEFAEQQIREHLGWDENREIEWKTGPEATMRKIEPPLDTTKRTWHIIGNVAVDENATMKFQISCCKEIKWLPIQRLVDGRTVFIDNDVLRPPPDYVYDYIIEPISR